MAVFESLSTSQKIHATVHRDVRMLCTETCHFLGMEMTKQAAEIVAELVYKKLSLYGSDLEAFAKHAKRSTINSEDVKLLVRRNPSLKSHLNTISMSVMNPVVQKDKRQKPTKSSNKQLETPSKSKEKDVEFSRPNEDKAAQESADDNMAVDSETIDLTFE